MPYANAAKGRARAAGQAATVAAPTALTSSAATGGDAPTEAEYNALRTDVSNLRTTVTNLRTVLRDAGVVA